MKAFDVKALYEKYCQKESDQQYYCVKDCRTYRIIPAAEAELTAFRANCIARNVPEETTEELLAYYRQNNNFLNDFSCDDIGIFEWWDDYRELWLGSLDTDVFRFCADSGKYTIGDGGNVSYGEAYEFDTLEQMLEAHFQGI